MKVFHSILYRSKNTALKILHPDLRHSFNIKSDMTLIKRLVLYGHGWAQGVKPIVNEDVLPLFSIHDQLSNML